MSYIWYRIWFWFRYRTSQSFRDYYQREREQAWDEGRPMIDVASEAVAQVVGEFMAKNRAGTTVVVRKMVGIIPHDCEGGAGCAFPGLPHVAKEGE